MKFITLLTASTLPLLICGYLGKYLTDHGIERRLKGYGVNRCNPSYECDTDRPTVRKASSIILAASLPRMLSEMNVAMIIDTTMQPIHDLDLEGERT